MSEPFLGQIIQVGFNFAPRGWSLCNGQLLPISQYTALFSLMGTTFGGDGRTTFGLPDLRGRISTHPGTGPGLTTIRWGEKGGRENVSLSANELPSHSHNLQGKFEDGEDSDPTGRHFGIAAPEDQYVSSSPLVPMGTTSSTGSGAPVALLNPFKGIYHCIAMVGQFPSRS